MREVVRQCDREGATIEKYRWLSRNNNTSAGPVHNKRQQRQRFIEYIGRDLNGNGLCWRVSSE